MNSTKKSVFKMIAITVVAGIIGMGFSTVGHIAASFMDGPLPLAWFAAELEYFLYGVLALQILLFLYFLKVRHQIKAEGYSDDDDSTYTRMEKKFGLLQGFGTTFAVGSLPLFFAVMFYCGIYATGTFVAFLAIIFINLCNEVGWIRLCGKVNPKLDTDWSKLSLNADLYGKMDEREREQMGQIGAKLVTSFHIIFAIAFMAVVFLGPLLALSGYELVVVGILWAVFSLFITVQKCKV